MLINSILITLTSGPQTMIGIVRAAAILYDFVPYARQAIAPHPPKKTPKCVPVSQMSPILLTHYWHSRETLFR